jgi:hypothetical protein
MAFIAQILKCGLLTEDQPLYQIKLPDMIIELFFWFLAVK